MPETLTARLDAVAKRVHALADAVSIVKPALSMPRAHTDRPGAIAFDAITVEGALIALPVLARIAQHQAGGQTEADYGIPKGLTLRNEIARYFRIGQALFKELTGSETPSTAATVNFVEKLLRYSLRKHANDR